MPMQCLKNICVHSWQLIFVTGAQAMATFHYPVPAEAYGQVNALQIQCFGSRKMLHLIPSGNPVVCTMVLCHRNETMLDELKVNKCRNLCGVRYLF